MYFYEKFTNDNSNNINPYFKPLKNIFLANNYYNYQNKPLPKIDKSQSIKNITTDAYLYSKPTTQKIICSSHTNVADCWEDSVNNCQWVNKIDSESYCNVAPIWLL
jgi:hypothetical protein